MDEADTNAITTGIQAPATGGGGVAPDVVKNGGDTRFKPGNPGRPSGAKNKLTKEQLRSAKEHFEPMLAMAAGIVSHHLMAHAPVVSEDEGGELVLEGLVRDCATCRHFITLVYDYAFGKPSQSLTLKGDDAAPLHVLHSARYEGWEAPSSLQEAQEAPQLPAPAPEAQELAPAPQDEEPEP